ncbi:Mitochondrial carrier domain-containing protein [Artemisia annua]|uniref:Mitochondrial carrier domain-containing protein n=1 Tax=Artemisia annua TaxID=35608 RepID=A0A2U1M3V5_ARTAN|nr:Mitochondrial carrier domain-containing protein [Artemisia annua]
MSLGVAEDDSGTEIHLPADIDWEMLDKSKFFFLGAALFSEAKAAAIANGVAGVSAAMAAQLVWTPIDVVSQRLMVQGGNNVNCLKYNGGIDAFRKIIHTDGIRGLYRGFGISILTYAPSNAVWWASYSMAHRAIWDGIGSKLKKDGNGNDSGIGFRPDSKAVVAVQAASAAMASGVSALVTMPLDTIKTRLQVIDGEGCNGIRQTIRKLMNEGGLSACYRGLGPRWVSMSFSATTMITTYEFLKKLSTKNQDSYGSLQ